MGLAVLELLNKNYFQGANIREVFVILKCILFLNEVFS